MRQRRPLVVRFLAKVRKTRGCWYFDGATDGCGYGQLKSDTGRGNVKAHRVAYALWIGPIPEGKDVLHRCDNPPCVRPAHLWAGTPSENARDMIAKGRKNAAQGERNGASKLTAARVHTMRRLRARGWSQQRIADRYHVSQVLVSKLLRGEVWKAF